MTRKRQHAQSIAYSRFITRSDDNTNAVYECRIRDQYPCQSYLFILTLSSQQSQCQKYHLPAEASHASFRYLHPSSLSTAFTDRHDFHKTTAALDAFGLGSHRPQILAVLAAVLHLGDVEFANTRSHPARQVVANPHQRSGCAVRDMFKLKIVASQLGLSAATLATALTHAHARGHPRPVDVREAEVRRDCLASGLYDRLLSWVFARINARFCALAGVSASPYHCMSRVWASERPQDRAVGIVDNMGFATTQHTTPHALEQLIINYAAEKMQAFYNNVIFERTASEYVSEGICLQVNRAPQQCLRCPCAPSHPKPAYRLHLI